jgi:hypothetical protein
MSKPDAAQLIAGAAIVLVVAGLALAGRTEEVKDPSGVTRRQRRSCLGAIVAGKDHRLSTSKTVAFAWTIAIVWGLLSLVVAIWLGDRAPWDKQVKLGLQEEYLLLLGGPYAAAVLAKYASQQPDAKTDAPVGSAKPSQLVNDDNGDTDLGDLQYVLFNLVGLAFFLGDFIGRLASGFPALPPILTGLILTSAGGYSAKKLVAQTVPTLSSVIPAKARPEGQVVVFGDNLVIPRSVSGGSDDEPPAVTVGGLPAEVTADKALGNDRLTVTVPKEAKPGSAPIVAVRADGAPARGPGGATALPFEVLAPVVSEAVETPPGSGAAPAVAGS